MTRIAKKLALKVTTRRQRHSCLILKGGRILSQANNEKGHAEQLALRLPMMLDRVLGYEGEWAKKHYKGAVLISFRIAPNGEIGKSKPCVKCAEAIQIAGIRKVIYFDGVIWKEDYQ